MNKIFTILLIFLIVACEKQKDQQVDHDKIKSDLIQLINDIKTYYAYLPEKQVEIDCIQDYYQSQIVNIQTEEQTVLFFEYLLDEFYDSHLILNTNRPSSYRLFSPVYAKIVNHKFIITNIWQSQITNLQQNIIGSEIIKINGVEFKDAIRQFPTHCSDKSKSEIREWIANKILSGRYNEPRILTLLLPNKKTLEFNLDTIKLKEEKKLITVSKTNNIGVIRFNNSLGNDNLVNVFDQALDSLMDTKGLILDLRNTIDGGNSYVARGIMGRFISESRPYQKHQFFQKSNKNPESNPEIERSWIEYVSPRKEQYNNPIVVLVDRWTGSMAEGLAIGFDGMDRAQIVGTEMERLAGEMSGFSFKYQNFGYRLSTAKLFHINGTPREKYVPTHYVKQTTINKDEILLKGIELINQKNE